MKPYLFCVKIYVPMWRVYHLKLLILMQAQILTGSTILRKSVRFSGINIFL